MHSSSVPFQCLSNPSTPLECNIGNINTPGYQPEAGKGALYPNEVASDFALIPFGGGARKCIGDQFALFEATVAMAMLLRRYTFRWVGLCYWGAVLQGFGGPFGGAVLGDLLPGYCRAPTTSGVLRRSLF